MDGYNYRRYSSNRRSNNDSRDNRRRTNYNSYIDGSVVRKYHTYSQPDEDKEWLQEIYRDRDREKAREERAKKTREKRLEQSKTMNLGAFAVLAVAVIFMLYLCAGYIEARSKVTTLNKDIVEKEAEYNALKAKNNSDLKEVEASINLQDIYKTATKDLGMVFANNNQIVTYGGSESAYVRQYEDIEEEFGENVLDDIANAVK